MSSRSFRTDPERLEELIDEATVDCYDEEEQHSGLLTMIGRCFKGVDLLSSIRGREAEKLQRTRVLSWFFKYFTAPIVKARILCAMV